MPGESSGLLPGDSTSLGVRGWDTLWSSQHDRSEGGVLGGITEQKGAAKESQVGVKGHVMDS